MGLKTSRRIGSPSIRVKDVSRYRMSFRGHTACVLRKGQLAPGVDIVATRHCEAAERSGYRMPCGFNAHLAGNGQEERYFANASRDGDFKFDRVLPGEYRIEIFAMGGYVSAITAGGVDLLATHKLVIHPGATAAPIDVWMRDD